MMRRGGERPTAITVSVLALTEDRDEARIALTRHSGRQPRMPTVLLDVTGGEGLDGAARRALAVGLKTYPLNEVCPLLVCRAEDSAHATDAHIVMAARIPSDVRPGVPGAVHAVDLPADSAPVHRARSEVHTRLLTDLDVARALLGARTTFEEVSAMLAACARDDGRVRLRFEGSPLYRRTGEYTRLTDGGRPIETFALTDRSRMA